MSTTYHRDVPADELALAARAKAGDRRAADELLRRAIPALRRIVARALARTSTRGSVHGDALSLALEEAWGAIPKWDPARASLATFVEYSVTMHVLRMANAIGHAVELPQTADGSSRYAPLASAWKRHTLDLDAPAPGADPSAPPLRETVPARCSDPSMAYDARRILARLSPDDADVLLAVASGEPMTAAAPGLSREGAVHRYHFALERARRAAAGQCAASPLDRARMRDDRILTLLAGGPMAPTDVHATVGAGLTKRATLRALQRLAQAGTLVAFRQDGRVVYALAAAPAEAA